jgi:alkanesulfonate monooxygenase SsuD/methylene tetrahydromethanopterin reductase-like flavin-dependent oxidoreductase (luciferase family)
MLRAVARYADAYNTMAHAVPETAQQQFSKLDEACEEVGRNPDTIQKTIGSFVAFPGAEDDPGGVNPNSISGEPEQVAASLHALHQQAGVVHANLFASPWGLKAVEYLGQTIKILRQMGS